MFIYKIVILVVEYLFKMDDSQ